MRFLGFGNLCSKEFFKSSENAAEIAEKNVTEMPKTVTEIIGKRYGTHRKTLRKSQKTLRESQKNVTEITEKRYRNHRGTLQNSSKTLRKTV